MLKKSVFFPMSELHILYFTLESPKIGPSYQKGEKGR